MKRWSWFITALLAAYLVGLLIVGRGVIERRERPRFVVLPHSVALSETETKAPTEAPGLEGLTADDIVRGMIFLARTEGDLRISNEQAAALLPQVKKMRTARHELLSLRQARHEANEAAMEDTLALAQVLGNRQVAAVLDRRGQGAASQADWQQLIAKVSETP